jgi:hypothetical protein
MKLLAKSLAFALAIVLLSSTMADAAILGWWRFGDDDGGLAIPPADGENIGPGSAANQRTVNHSGTLDGMYFQTANPKYSDVVPGAEIYDPITDITLNNDWSMHTPGLAGNERLRPGAVDVPNVFTFEAFVEVGSSIDGFIFVNHASSNSTGWRIQRQNNGAVTAQLVASGSASTTITSEAGVLPLNEWRHVAVVYQNSSEDDVNDFFLYVDYNLVAEGNGLVSPSGNPTLHVGNPSSGSTRIVRMDEVRYFNSAETPDKFLQVVPEPNALILASIGVIGLATYRWRRRNATCK